MFEIRITLESCVLRVSWRIEIYQLCGDMSSYEVISSDSLLYNLLFFIFSFLETGKSLKYDRFSKNYDFCAHDDRCYA